MNREINAFPAGVENLLDDEIISQAAASDSQNWITQDDKLQLIPGKLLIGQAGAVGPVQGEIFGYTTKGVQVHWRKIGTVIQYFNTTTQLWTTTITGLTASADYTFSNYESLAGAFTFAIGADGIFKMNNATPGNYFNMYNAVCNFKGFGIIDKGRMLLWNNPNDQTGLYGSHIDPQASPYYIAVQNAVIQTGNGSTKSYTGIFSLSSLCNMFGLSIWAPTGPTLTVSAITNAVNAQITTSAPHNLNVGDSVVFNGVKAGVPLTGTGTVSASGNYNLTGSGTAFTTQLKVGARLYVTTQVTQFAGAGSGGGSSSYLSTQALIVQSIADDTHLSLQFPINFGATGQLIGISSSPFTFSSMSQLTNVPALVNNVIDASNFTIAVNSTNFDVYSSGDTVNRAEVLMDNYDGTLSGVSGATGTINYMTGAYTMTFINAVANSANVVATYSYENSNNGGVTDFTYSATRLASEGFVVRQDEGGDPILNVLIGANGYYSMKSQSAYLLVISADDLSIDNNVYRKQMGISSRQSCLSTDAGILFMNTANPGKPELTLLVKNVVDGTLEPKVICSQFRFANYEYDDCTFFPYDRYMLIACKTLEATNDDTTLLVNVSLNTVLITNYAARTFASDGILLYMGSSVVESVYNLFSGVDDDGFPIFNYWITKGENFAVKLRGTKWLAFPWSLKKYRWLRFRGHITPGQSVGVYANYDDSGWQLVGTILSTANYVDQNNPATLGSSELGINTLGGNIINNAYPFQMQMRMKKMPKFRKRKIKLVALGFGYVDFTYEADWDVTLYNDMKLPTRFREKQNVALAGAPDNQPLPEF